METNFKNILLLFPPHILKEVNRLVDDGVGSVNIRKVIMDRYRGNLKIPGHDTIQRYIDWYRDKRSSPQPEVETETNIVPVLPTGIESVKEELATIKSTTKSVLTNKLLSFENRKIILEDLVTLCYQRMKLIEEHLTNEGPSQVYEGLLGSYIRECRGTVETLAKIAGEMKGGSETIFKNLVDQYLSQIVLVFMQCVIEIYGNDKIEPLKERIKMRLKDRPVEVSFSFEKEEVKQVEEKTDGETKTESAESH